MSTHTHISTHTLPSICIYFCTFCKEHTTTQAEYVET